MIRTIITLVCVFFLLCTPVLAQDAITANITEEQIQQGEEIAQKAFEETEKGNFAVAEKYWTELIEKFPTNPAVWSNRGNSRISQNKLEEAIADFNQAISIAPDAPDPYLNRGAALEGMKRYSEAIEDYNRVLEINPQDAMAYNNRGNASAGEGNYQQALADYEKAAELEPNFAFARANAALVLYQVDRKEEALKSMRNLVRKYPMFPDMRAALTAILWEKGEQGEAESNWVATMGIDSRYKDIDWVKNIRRWPPAMVDALDKFLKIK